MISNELKNCIDKSVLCWLATSNRENEPNVSPKEMFALSTESTLLIANIASPETVQNVKLNPKVCVSILDIFVQKGYKIKGIAKIIDKTDNHFEIKHKILTDLFTDEFPIRSIIEVEIQQVDKIVAPSYYLFPETREENQIESAMKTYKVKPIE